MFMFTMARVSLCSRYLSWEVKLGVTDLSANEEFVETRISSIGISHGGFVVNNDQDNIGIILVGEVLENGIMNLLQAARNFPYATYLSTFLNFFRNLVILENVYGYHAHTSSRYASILSLHFRSYVDLRQKDYESYY